MKNLFLMSILTLGFSLSAQADGFICEGLSTGITVRVYNHTEASQGTRTPAIMVLADPAVHYPLQTIATFSDQNRTLSYLGHGQYFAKVDLRFLDSGRKGENVGGTKLGELKSIQLNVNFSYSHAATDLADAVDHIPAKIFYNKRTGEILEENAHCTRYLKN